MAQSKLKYKGSVVGMEQGTSKFAAAATLSGASFTIPANTGDVICHPSAACHYHPTGTPTSSYGHAVLADELFLIKASDVGRTKIIGDAGAITMTVAYMRGAGRQDAAYTAQARPN